MRVLFTTQPAVGHFHPLVPLARALVDAGHTVAFATAPSFCPTVASAGFRAFPAGLDWLESEAERAFPELRGMASPVPYWAFAGVTAQRMVPDLLAFAESWRPDVLVHESAEFGAPVAAERLGLPHAMAGPPDLPMFERPDLLQRRFGAPLADLRRAHGLQPDPDLTALHRYLTLAAVPPRFLHDTAWVSPVTHFLRPVPFDRTGDEGLPAWVGELPPRPTVYVTLGTVFNRTTAQGSGHGLFRAIIAGLRDEPANLVLTVGRNVDPARFGPQPPGVRVERYIPQTLLLPHCAAVIAHGGFNTVMAALDGGLPLVLLPLGADQPHNARRCAALGVGRVLAPDARTLGAIREAVRAVLVDPAYRREAARLREELRALPGPGVAVTLLERLVVEGAPQINRPGSAPVSAAETPVE